MKTLSILAGLLLATANAAATKVVDSQLAARADPPPKQEPSAKPQLNVINSQGCFDDKGELESFGTPDFNSKSKCAELTCKAKGYPVAATSGGNECWCGKKYPSAKSKVDDSKCDTGCAGYPIEACGGVGFWTVFHTGITLNVEAIDEPPKGKSDGPAVTTVVPTVVVTEPAAPESKGTNVGAIAGGVVVAIVVVTGVVGGFFFYMRRKRNREIEEDHRRNAAVNSFISGKAPSSSGMSISDSRLDPVMAHRRMSDGSIADNQDYSRKILRVTNA